MHLSVWTFIKKNRRYREYRHKITLTIKKPIELGICKIQYTKVLRL